MKVIPLNEGYYTIGFDKVFYPFNPDKDVLEERSRGSLLVEIQPFLVQKEGKNILFDTGLGFKNSVEQLVIEQNLKKVGVGLEDINYVVMSHLHKDHAGGLSYLSEANQRIATFPNAAYFIGKNEYDFALKKGEPSYTVEDLELLKMSDSIHWLEAEGIILDFIEYKEDGGHCPHHISFKLNGETTYFFGGDVAPQLKQLKFRYMAKYDFDPRKSAELREQYGKKGREENWTFMFYHDVKIPLSKLD